jgi:hypothetical protein
MYRWCNDLTSELLQQLIELPATAFANRRGRQREQVSQGLQTAALECRELFVQRFKNSQGEPVQPLVQWPVDVFGAGIAGMGQGPGGQRGGCHGLFGAEAPAGQAAPAVAEDSIQAAKESQRAPDLQHQAVAAKAVQVRGEAIGPAGQGLQGRTFGLGVAGQ